MKIKGTITLMEGQLVPDGALFSHIIERRVTSLLDEEKQSWI